MVGVEEDAAVGSKGGDLAELKQQNTSLFSLIGILLSPRTFPHLVTIVVFTVLLNLLARNGSTSLSAMGFLSLSAGYFVTGLLSGNERVRSFTQLQPKEEASEGPLWKRMVFSFRICLLPLTFSVICFASLASLGDGNETLPLLLSSCFVVWAAVQGRSFGSFLSSLSARKLPPASPRANVTNPFSVGMSYLCVLLLSVVLVIAFEFLASSNGDWASWLVDNVLFFFMLTGLYILTWRRTRDVRQQASGQADHHAYATRWLLLSQLLITWHLLTVWRHWTISPGGPLLFVEELVLMVFTVLMAIWGLTSRTFRSPLKLVTLDNATDRFGVRVCLRRERRHAHRRPRRCADRHDGRPCGGHVDLYVDAASSFESRPEGDDGGQRNQSYGRKDFARSLPASRGFRRTGSRRYQSTTRRGGQSGSLHRC